MIFHIDNEKHLACDLDELIGTRMLVQANSGGGKSWLLRRILEQTHGHVQQIVIDPEGEFASLREKYDYIHAAPSGGDTVATPRSAALLAEKLLELRVSAILDIYELHPHERVRFVKIFLEALVNLPKRLWHETLVVVDEAHAFAPEKGSAESLSAMIGLASLGRKRGFAALYATQRIQKLHKDAAADLNNKLIGRTSLDIDIARAGDELGFDKLKRRGLPHLAPGQFFATGPAFNQRGVVEVFVGKVHTTHPKAGKRIAFTAPPPTAKIKALLPQLSDLPAEAEKKAKTEEDLRKEIAALKSEITRTKVPAVGSRVDDVAMLRALKRGLAEAMKIVVKIATLESPNVPDMEGVLAAAVHNVKAQFEREIAPRSRQIEQLRAQAEELVAQLKKMLEEDIVVDVVVRKQEPFVVSTKAPPALLSGPARPQCLVACRKASARSSPCSRKAQMARARARGSRCSRATPRRAVASTTISGSSDRVGASKVAIRSASRAPVGTISATYICSRLATHSCSTGSASSARLSARSSQASSRCTRGRWRRTTSRARPATSRTAAASTMRSHGSERSSSSPDEASSLLPQRSASDQRKAQSRPPISHPTRATRAKARTPSVHMKNPTGVLRSGIPQAYSPATLRAPRSLS